MTELIGRLFWLVVNLIALPAVRRIWRVFTAAPRAGAIPRFGRLSMTTRTGVDAMSEQPTSNEQLMCDVTQLLMGWKQGCAPGEWSEWDEQVLRRWQEWRSPEPSVMGAGKGIPPMPTVAEAIEAHVRRIEILCDAANLDPAQWLVQAEDVK